MRNRAVLPLLFFAAAAAHADVTIRQTMEFQIKLPLPQAQALPSPFNKPIEIVSRIKGGSAYALFGTLAAISDGAKKQVTLLDTQGKRYATIPLADFAAQMQSGAKVPEMPEDVRQLLAGIKADVQSNPTGRTERIFGIEAVETEVVFHLTIPVPIPGQEKGLEVVGKFQSWKPKPGEAARVPALREMEAYYTQAGEFADSGAMLKRMLASFPGLGDKLETLTGELTKGGRTSLRMHGAFFVPGLAAIMAQTGANGGSTSGLPGPDTPLMEIKVDVTGLDTDPVPDSLFAIPAGYQPAPVDDLVKSLLSGAAAAK